MYNHAPENYLCPFCLLIQGGRSEHAYSIESDIVYQDQTITALVSSHQWNNNPGNVIIIPNKHFENIYDLPISYAQDIHKLARNLALVMKLAYSCDGISTRQHNEPAGSQDVWHYHVHVTPRYKNDNYYKTPKELMPSSERAKHAEAIKKSLATIHINE